ncbi:Laminin subunit alpha-4 [Tupaia chinensis]|uniref:Laminin subunit alpha-4 n=1 Tax=Tupaia chinensis TaxID=246437 RepID=L9JHW6_TUPCH|nr:Laminin subunit alpha-4 [Tupaia chinensis]
MTLGAAWSAVLPLWLLWGAACSSAASGDGNAFPFDIEGSSAVGRQDPPEMSEPRVAPGPLPPVAEESFCQAKALNACTHHWLPSPLHEDNGDNSAGPHIYVSD